MKNIKQRYLLFILSLIWLAVFYIFNPFVIQLHIDEVRFIETAKFFSQSWIPTKYILKNYSDLNTPLVFIIWGWLVKIFGVHLWVGRIFNFILGLSITYLFTTYKNKNNWRAALSVLGLLTFPYFFFASIYMYTDMLAVFCLFIGFIAYTQRSFFLMGIVFSLAVFTRQYMVVFPTAIATFHLLQILSKGCNYRSFLSNIKQEYMIYIACFLPILVLLIWVLFLGGMAPKAELERQNYGENALDAFHVVNMLYGMASAGAFCAVVEVLLFKETLKQYYSSMTPLGIISIVFFFALFLIYLPLKQPVLSAYGTTISFKNMGALHIAIQHVMVFMSGYSYYFEQFIYWILIMIFCQRFLSEVNFLAIVAFFHFVILLKTFWVWDKYNLPFVVLFWFIKRSPELFPQNSILNLLPLLKRLRIS